MYNNFVFDVYGTLVDIHTNEYDLNTWQKLAHTLSFYDVNYTAEELKEAYFMSCDLQIRLGKKIHKVPEVDVVEVSKHIFANKGKKITKSLATHLAQEFRAFSTERLRVYPDVIDTLKQLKRAHKKLYILANAQRCYTKPELEKLGLLKYFTGVIYSSDHGCAKPDVKLFDIACEKFKLNKAETIYIGNDPKTDVDGTKAAKIDCLWIKTNLTDHNARPKLPPKYTVENGDFKEIAKLLLKK